MHHSPPLAITLFGSRFGAHGGRRRRGAGRGKGICAMVRRSLASRCTKVHDGDMALWIKVSSERDRQPLHVGCCYVPPATSARWRSGASARDVFCGLQQQVANYSECGQVLLFGDFNARTAQLCDIPEECDQILSDLHVPPEHRAAVVGVPRERSNTDQGGADAHGRLLIQHMSWNWLHTVAERPSGGR